MPQLPWEAANGGLAPWAVGRVFIGPDNYAYQIYKDNTGVGQATGYVMKRFNPSNPSESTFSAAPAPYDPQAQYDYYNNSPMGQAQQAYEQGIAENNAFGRKMQQNASDVAQAGVSLQQGAQRNQIDQFNQNLRLQRDQLALQVGQQAADLWYHRALVSQAQQQLGLESVKVGAGLRGPRDFFQYSEAASGVRNNPALASNVASWFNPQSNVPTGTGAWQGGNPQAMTLGGLAQDFGGNPSGGGGGWGSGGPVTDTNKLGFGSLDSMNEFFKNPQKAVPGFLESKNPTQIGLLQSAADYLGHDWDTVNYRYGATRPGQGITSGMRA